MKTLYISLLLTALSLGLQAQTPVVLNSAGSFAVLGGSTVTNTGATVVTGNLGLSPGSAVTGFPPGIVTGGVTSIGGPAATGQGDLTTAYNDAAGRPCPGGNTLPGDIGGMTLLPGVYCNATSVGITGTVTLNGNGNSGAVFIIQTGSTLTTAAGNSVVNLINGAVASNVFWKVGSSATLGTTTFFAGTILAQASITLTTGAVLNGRALARTGAVTLAGNAVTNPGGPVGSGAPLTLSCAFTAGQVGQPYVSALVAGGGLSPYTYAISAGSLPPVLTLNTSTGAIAGTPTTAGTFNYTARVTDSASTVVTTTCGAIIIAPQAPPVTPAPPTLVLMSIALACLAAYQGRDRFMRLMRWN
jgi:hypothetical protein